MTPLKTTIEGSIGIKAGLGRDELTVDFRELIPAGAKMVAFQGDNGSGKSTFFNLAMTPWLKPNMLQGTLYDEFMEGKGRRELLWEHDGQQYISKIIISRTTSTRSTKAYLHVVNSDGTIIPYSRADGLASDGKGKTYTACLEDILGPQSIYYLSAYRAQGAPKLAEYSQPKELMRDLLSLDEPHSLAKKAGKVRTKLSDEVLRLEGVAKEAEEARQRLSNLSMDIDENRKAIAVNMEKRERAEEQHTIAQADMNNAASDNFEQTKLQQAIDDMDRRIADERARCNAEVAAAKGQLTMVEKQRRERTARHTTDMRKHDATVFGMQNEVVRIKSLLDQEEQIKDAVQEIDALNGALSLARSEKEILDTNLLTYNKNKLVVVENKNKLDATIERGKELRAQIDSLSVRAGYVEVVPCHGEGKYADCPALADAKAAGEMWPKVSAARDEVVAQYKIDLPKLHKLEAALGDYDLLIGKIAETDRVIANINDRFNVVRPVAAKVEILEDARQKSNDLDAAILSLINDKDVLLKENETSELRTKEEMLCARKTVEDATADAKTRVEKLISDREFLPKPENDKSAELSGLAIRARTEAAEAVKAHEASIAHNEQMKAERVALEKELVRNKDRIEKHAQLVGKFADWGLLEKSLYGAIDLSIEAAGPAIAAAANALLNATYGPRFTVKIVTQRQNLSNPTIREVFSINVIDGQTGREDDVLKKSGGESVWIGKALTDGVGIHFQQSSGVRYETQFGDEVEDGLTQERKQMFYQMDRAAVEAGGYSRKYFISHDPSGWAMADHVIDFEEFRV